MIAVSRYQRGFKMKNDDKLLQNFKGENMNKDEINKAYDEAHKDYKKRKNEVITKLYTIWRNTDIPAVYRDWIRQAARFINEKEI